MNRQNVCPRCGGSLYKDRDQYGPFITCLQCGAYPSDTRDLLDLSDLAKAGRRKKNVTDIRSGRT